jgi:pyroglutamyl-peptidase
MYGLKKRCLVSAGAIVVGIVVATLSGAQDGASESDPREQAVSEMIERYFMTWSAQDLDRYGQCFIPQAVIQLIDPQGRVATMPLKRFLDGQRQSQQEAGRAMVETPESIEVRFEARLARVVVFWKLVDGDRVEYGYDHFTLMQSGGQWRIANLIFYATPEEEGPQR